MKTRENVILIITKIIFLFKELNIAPREESSSNLIGEIIIPYMVIHNIPYQF